jgi:hypothetical protein
MLGQGPKGSLRSSQSIEERTPVKPRLVLQACALAAALFLGGCFVTSNQKPLQIGPVNDETLVGDWRAVDTDSGKLLNSFIHIQKSEQGAPLRVVYVEDDDYAIYEMTTTRAGSRKVFALKAMNPDKAREEIGSGFLLGYYELAGEELQFHMLDAETVSALIQAGRISGIPAKRDYERAQLTGTPEDITRFLASDEGWKGRVEEASRMRRMRPEE